MRQHQFKFHCCFGESTQVVRISRNLYEEILTLSRFFGEVEQIYQNGFDLIRKDSLLIHFQGEKCLHSPFSAVLSNPIKIWKKNVNLEKGDIYHFEDKFLRRVKRKGCSIYFNPYDVVDLKNKLFTFPPDNATLLFWIWLLIKEIRYFGSFEGIAGTLSLLGRELSTVFSDFSVEKSIWSRHALPEVEKLLKSVVEDDLYGFVRGWSSIVGLGPGLTPAGDDFLVGFLAAHRILASPFAENFKCSNLKIKLKRTASFRTGTVAFQFLKYALEGIFSESLYLVFKYLKSLSWLEAEKNNLQINENKNQLKYFLQWGHSSGVDTLTGVVFGFWSIISRNERSVQ
jgi:hypothetical protein